MRQRAALGNLTIALGLGSLVILLASICATPGRGASGRLPTPTPSFDLSATITIPALVPAPGCPLTGTYHEFIGVDGTHYIDVNQINILSPCPSPTPSPTPAPTETPTPTPTPTPAPPVVTVIDDEFFTFFGTWTAYAKTTTFTKYNIGDHASSTTGAAVGFIFTGTEVRLFGAVAPQNGIASVRVDGGAAVDADLYGPIRIDQAPLFYSGPLAPGVHRIVMTVTGRKNAAATGTVVPIDRADILDGTIVPPLTP